MRPFVPAALEMRLAMYLRFSSVSALSQLRNDFRTIPKQCVEHPGPRRYVCFHYYKAFCSFWHASVEALAATDCRRSAMKRFAQINEPYVEIECQILISDQKMTSLYKYC